MELTKAQRRELGRWADIAYERMLRAELAKLDAEFARWRAGEIDSFALSDPIHRFHNGPAHELWGYYTGRAKEVDKVARAVGEGQLAEGELPEFILAAIQPILQFWRDSEANDEQPDPDAQE